MWKKSFTWAVGLTSPEKAVLNGYEEMAGGGPHVYVTTEVLCIMTGLSRAAALKARRSVTEKGWLTEVKAATPRSAGKFALTVPADVAYHEKTPASILETLPTEGAVVVGVVEEATSADGGRRPRTILAAVPTWERDADGLKDYSVEECEKHEGMAGGFLPNGAHACPVCRRQSAVAR